MRSRLHQQLMDTRMHVWLMAFYFYCYVSSKRWGRHWRLHNYVMQSTWFELDLPTQWCKSWSATTAWYFSNINDGTWASAQCSPSLASQRLKQMNTPHIKFTSHQLVFNRLKIWQSYIQHLSSWLSTLVSYFDDVNHHPFLILNVGALPFLAIWMSPLLTNVNTQNYSVWNFRISNFLLRIRCLKL